MGKMKDLFIAHPDCSKEIVIFQHICGLPEGSYRSRLALQCMRENSEELLRITREYRDKQKFLSFLTGKPTSLDKVLAAVQEIATKQLHVLYGV